MNPIAVHIPEARLHAHHRSRRGLGCGAALGGLALFGLGTAASGLIWEPLVVLAFPGFVALIIGPFLGWQSHQALRHLGDLQVDLTPEGFRHRQGEADWSERRPLQVALAEKDRVDLIAVGVPILTLALPMGESEKETLVADLRTLGVPVDIPDRSIRRIAGIVALVVLGVGAFFIVWRLLLLAALGLVFLGITLVAPDDPAVQVGLFFGLAFGLGLPVLVVRLLSRARRS